MGLTSRDGAVGWGSRFAGLVSAVLLLGVVATAVGELPRDRANSRPDTRGLTLSTTPNSEIMDRNRVILLLQDNAEIGSSGSSVAGGGFWITTTDQYVFSAGPNIGALLPDGSVVVAIGGPFSELEAGGPTFDAIGLDEYFSTDNPEDEGNFPSVCTVDEFRVTQFPSLSPFSGDPFPGFADKTVCIAANDIQGGTCADCGGTRVGVEIVETIFAFGVPSVQDFVFFAVRVFNRSEFVNTGNAPAQPVPGPYDLTDTIVAFAIDPDVGSAGDDQIAFLPEIQTMVYWDSDFTEPQFQNLPGFGGITYLKTPEVNGEEVGLAEFTVFTNGNPRPDPTNKEEWYALMTGDPTEVVLEVDPRDVRGMASSAPFPLPAGEFVEIYGAYFFANISGAPPGQLLAEGYKDLNTGALIPTANDDPVFDNFKAVQLTALATFNAGFVVPTAPPKPDITLAPGDQQVTLTWNGAPIQAVNPFAKVARDPFTRLPNGQPDPEAPGTGIILAAGDIIYDPARDTGGTSGFVTAATAGLTGAEVTNAAYNPDFVIQDFQGFNVYRSFDGINTTLIAQFDLTDGIAGGTFCTSAVAVFDSQDPPGLAGVVCTGQAALNIGSDSGLGFAVIDRGGAFPDPSTGPGLINGIPVFYTVTSFAVNPGQSPVDLPSQAAFDLLNAGPVPAAPLVLEAGQSPLLQATPRSNASSFANANVGAVQLLGGLGNPLSNITAPMPLDANNVPNAPLPPSGTFNATVNIVNPLGIPDGFEAQIVIDDHPARVHCLSAPGVCNNYDTDFCGCGFGAAFDQLLGVDVRGREVFFRVTDGSGNTLQTPEGPAVGTIFTDFISFNGTAGFASPTFSILSPSNPADGVAFTIGWDSDIGNRANQCARQNTCNLLNGSRSGPPASVANVDFEVGAYGQYMYGDVELVWSNQGGVLSIASATNLSNNTSIPFGSTFGCDPCWGFAAETGLGVDEEGLAAAIGGVPRTASGKVLYPDPLFTFLGGQNSSFAGAIQGRAHWTDLPFDPNVLEPALASPGFPFFRGTFLQEGAYQQNAALFTCPGAGGGFACAGAGAGLQGTRLYLAGTYLDLAFSQLPADGEVWIVQLSSATATTPRPPVGAPGGGMAISIPIDGGSNNLSDADLSAITVVPNPFIAANEITRGRGLQRILFTQLPPQATIRIYTISGNLIRVLEHSDGSGTEAWDVRTRFDLLAASGNYYFHVTTPDGRTHLGRFAVVN